MTYNTYEQSLHAGAPIEAYRFIGAFREYRYTSADESVTVGGRVYDPVPITRGAAKAGTHEEDSAALELTVPADLDLVRDYAYSQAPPTLDVEVYRVHRGTDFASDYAMLWCGRVMSFTVAKREAKIQIPSIFAYALRANVPPIYYQQSCNWALFDGRCGVASGAHTQTTTVTVTGSGSFEVTTDGFADGYLKAGTAAVSRTGEIRMILNNTSNLVRVNFPFSDMIAGDEVVLKAGCDHSYTTCVSKFSNGARFGGHKDIPADNPFMGEL